MPVPMERQRERRLWQLAAYQLCAMVRTDTLTTLSPEVQVSHLSD